MTTPTSSGGGSSQPPHSVPLDEQQVITKHLNNTGRLVYVTTGSLYAILPNTEGWTDLQKPGYVCLIRNYNPLKAFLRFYAQGDTLQDLVNCPLSVDMYYEMMEPAFHTFIDTETNQQYGITYNHQHEALALATDLNKSLPTVNPAATPISPSNTKPADSARALLGKVKSFFGAGEKKTVSIGVPTDVKHVAHVGYDANAGFDLDKLAPEWKDAFKSMGIRKKDLQDPVKAAVIYKTVWGDENAPTGNPNAASAPAPVKGAPPPPPPRPTRPARPTRASIGQALASPSHSDLASPNTASTDIVSPSSASASSVPPPLHSPTSPPVPGRRPSASQPPIAPPTPTSHLHAPPAPPIPPPTTPGKTSSSVPPPPPMSPSNAPAAPVMGSSAPPPPPPPSDFTTASSAPPPPAMTPTKLRSPSAAAPPPAPPASGGEGDLLAAIRAGGNLKKVHDRSASITKSPSGTLAAHQATTAQADSNDLLAAIRAGKPLRKASDRAPAERDTALPDINNMSGQDKDNIMALLAHKFQSLRAAEEDDDNDDWD